jgi:cell division septum initiation protein DivIVA
MIAVARPETPGNKSERAMEAEIARYSDTAATELAAAQAGETETSRRYGSRSSSAERDRLVQDTRNIDFPIALRGYERTAVDRYVKDVNRLITELEMSSSPESAVRRALEEVSEETRDLLQRAHQAAEDITARSRRKADERVRQAEDEGKQLRGVAQAEADEVRARAEQEAHELREAAQRDTAQVREDTAREMSELRETTGRETKQLRSTAQREVEELRGTARREVEELREAAEARVRELSQNAETIWRERRRLIEDMRAVGEQLMTIGEAEAKRFARFGENGAFGDADPSAAGPSAQPTAGHSPATPADM